MSNKSTTVVTYPDAVTDPGYIDLWHLEKAANQAEWADWYARNYQVPFIITFIYISVIMATQARMKSRRPFDLRLTLVTWDTGLAVFSTLVFVRSVPELLHILTQPYGVHLSICSRSYRNSATVFWGSVYGLSKVAELGDTFFIVLRKRPLTFLHVYHHVTVLLFTWIAAPNGDSTFLWFGLINCAIHAIMYSYYALKAVGVYITHRVSLAITSVQLLQMVLGLVINSYVVYVKQNGGNCDTHMVDVYLAFVLYATYFLLFAKYFYFAYVFKSVKKTN